MALAMQRGVSARSGEQWRKRGYDLGLGCGVAQGYATLGADRLRGPLGLRRHRQRHQPGRTPVCRGGGGQVLVDRKTMARVEELVQAEPVGPLTLKGFAAAGAGVPCDRAEPAPAERRVSL